MARDHPTKKDCRNSAIGSMTMTTWEYLTAPLIVQGTFIAASGILTEAILSFLGVGLPPDIPTWGNVMAEGREQFAAFPHNILFPGIFLALTVLSVNILGDGLRDLVDPRLAKES